MGSKRVSLSLLLSIMIFIYLPSCSSTAKRIKDNTPVPVSGTVYEPAGGAYIYLYGVHEDPHGPPRYVIPAPTTKDGTFTINVEPGKYLLVARKRANGENSGPLSRGDIRSEPVEIDVRKDSEINLSMIMEKKGDSTVKAYENPKGWKTSLSGTVIDADGNPVSGARVHVYTYIQMSERPKYVSDKTGADGRYIVFLPKGGTYYLAARNRFGGPPRIGDLYGRYDKGSIDPSAVVVKEGQHLDKVDIIVFKVW